MCNYISQKQRVYGARQFPGSWFCMALHILYFNPTIFWLEHLSLAKKTLFGGLKEIRRVTDIISHSSSERKSTFNASRWSKLSNITGYFTACISAHSPAAELDNVIQFRLQSGLLSEVSTTCNTAPNSPAVQVIVSFKTCQGLEHLHRSVQHQQT